MQAVVEYLRTNSCLFLATIGRDGKPKVRPFQFMLEDGGKLWFCTGKQKNVYAELQQNPALEMSVSAPDFSWLRICAKAVFSDDVAVRERILAEHPLVRSIYKEAANPDFAIFYLAQGRATLSDFSGQPPREFELG